MSYKTYENYKDSGNNFISKMPDHWDLAKFKIFYSYVKGKNPKDFYDEDGEGLIPYLSMDYLRNKSEAEFVSVEDCSVKATNGDILLLWDGSNAGEFVVSKYGAVSSTMAKLIPNMPINENYSKYLCKSIEPLLRELTIGMGVPHVNTKELNSMIIPFIDIREQEHIAKYLDKKTTEIDANIAKNKELISLLEEKKVALINQVVTKGLDLNAPMKDSGMEWIGEIPEHWNLIKISYLFEIIGSGTTPKSSNEEYYINGDVNWLITGDLNDGFIDETSTKITKKALYDISSLKIYPKNSLVIAMYGATIGKLGILNIETCTNQACCVLSKSDELIIKYAFYWFLGFRSEIISLSYGGGQPNISQDTIKNLKIIKPTIEEQKQIVNYLDTEILKIEKTIEKIQKNIDLLEEYKASMIHHVITGKIDVRDEV